jgi:glycosyltransferase involved in cell wall biosynthesis
LFISRISEQKNLSSLLQVLKNCNLKSLIIGSGVLKEKLLQKYGTKKSVVWMDQISNHKIPHYMNQSKLFILPSYYEGHPKILIEAMSCGMIVLASNVDGNNQIVRDNINGFLCEPNHRSIEEKINDILKMDYAKLNQIRTSARDHILNQFSIEKVVKMELDLYQNIFANKKNYH